MPLPWNPKKGTELPIYGKTPAHKRPVQRTLLYAWLKANQMGRNHFGRQVGCAPKMVDYWCDGQCIPSLPYAFQIEKVTGGGVPVASWLGTEKGRLAWQNVQERARRASS